MNSVTLHTVWAPQQQLAWSAGVVVCQERSLDQWDLQRRCSLSPAQFGGCFVALVVMSALVAGFFWAMGAGFVTWFAGVEVVLVGVAFGVHALHAADGEQLQVADGWLNVEQRSGLRVNRQRLALPGLRVTATADGLIELNLQGRRWVLGRHATDAARRQALAGLRRVLTTVNG